MKNAVIVTGASGGIGTAICSIFLQNGYTVIGVYHKNETDLEQLSRKFGKTFYYFSCDLSDPAASSLLMAKIRQLNVNIEILINNAGISVVGLLQELNPDTWNLLWNTNVTSAVFLSKEIIPLFLQNGRGKIINISSVWGNIGASMEVAYSATKGALNTFTKALAKELAPANIQVNAISCGIIDTKMNSHLSKEELDAIIEQIPSGRIGTPEDIAQAVYELAITGNYMTGQIITVDGGWT